MREDGVAPSDPEARRLTAGCLNIVAASAVSIGGLAPFATLLVADEAGHAVRPARLAATVALFLLLGLLLHLAARAVLPRPPLPPSSRE